MNMEFARTQTTVTGMGGVCGACDATPFLRMRKLRKFMGKQDDLAVVAAGRALESASLAAPLGERCGLYLAVGYIPFQAEDIDGLLDASLEAGQFSMQRFAANAVGAINPLLTFRVLPNMPAFHVSLNFDIQGPYAISYPGAGQFYAVLDEAMAALECRVVDVALVGAVADQQNVLVEHHFSRVTPPVNTSRLANAAAFLVIERLTDAAARGAIARAALTEYHLEYVPVDPFDETTPAECLARDGQCLQPGAYYGPASLALSLTGTSSGRVTHKLRTRDGFIAGSTWEVA
jgi:3-oxoacyl-(acyl-carrier-protein) synthase